MNTRWTGSLGALAVVLAGQTGLAQPPELARTPPMGWNSWNHFQANINDAIIRAEANAMVTGEGNPMIQPSNNPFIQAYRECCKNHANNAGLA